jgi:hypothetical protein
MAFPPKVLKSSSGLNGAGRQDGNGKISENLPKKQRNHQEKPRRALPSIRRFPGLTLVSRRPMCDPDAGSNRPSKSSRRNPEFPAGKR